MIWLNKKDNDRDFITCNMITCSDDKLKCLEEIKTITTILNIMKICN